MGWEEGLEGCGGVMSERAGVCDWKVVWGFFTCMQFAQIPKPFASQGDQNSVPRSVEAHIYNNVKVCFVA